MFGWERESAGADIERLGAGDLRLKTGQGASNFERLQAGGDLSVAVVIVHLIPKFDRLRGVEIDGVENDESAGFMKYDGACHVGNEMPGTFVGIGGIARDTHPIIADLVTVQLGLGLGGVGPFLAFMVGVTATIYK